MEQVASSSHNVFAVSDYREMEGNVESLRREIFACELHSCIRDAIFLILKVYFKTLFT